MTIQEYKATKKYFRKMGRFNSGIWSVAKQNKWYKLADQIESYEDDLLIKWIEANPRLTKLL